MIDLAYPRVHAKPLPDGGWDVFCRACGTHAWLFDDTVKKRFEARHTKCREGKR